MPLLMAKRALKEMNPGEVLEVLATDPGSVKDFESFSKAGGLTVKSESLEDGAWFRHTITIS